MTHEEALKFQVQALEKRYLDELGRRNAVRNTLALPIGVLSFASFGFAALATTFRWAGDTLAAALLSSFIVLLGVGALIFFLRALFRFYDVDLDSNATDPAIYEFAENARAIETAESAGGAAATARSRGIELALEYLSDEYILSTEALAAENRDALQVQQDVLRSIGPGLGMLITAIALAAALRVADGGGGGGGGGDAAGTGGNGQEEQARLTYVM